MILLDQLEEVASLTHFSGALVKKIAKLAQLREFQAGEEIFREGDRNPHLYIVLSGEVGLEFRVSRLGTVHVLTVGPGELVGWSPLLGGAAMTATARAETDCRLAALDAAQIQALAEQDTRFGMEFFRGAASALAHRLYAARLEIPHAAHGRGPIRCEPSE